MRCKLCRKNQREKLSAYCYSCNEVLYPRSEILKAKRESYEQELIEECIELMDEYEEARAVGKV